MTQQRLYFGIENLALNTAQKQDVITALRELGVNNQHPNPAQRNHWRTRLDGDAVIFEAAFDTDNLTIASIKQFLADAVGVQASNVDHSTQDTARGIVVTYTHNATDYLRLVGFGTSLDGGALAWPGYGESHAEAVAYLIANSGAWEDEGV